MIQDDVKNDVEVMIMGGIDELAQLAIRLIGILAGFLGIGAELGLLKRSTGRK